jgi:hypothetical protein
MLISFSVSNFRSFGDEVTLDMIASPKLADHSDHLIPIGDTGKHVVRSAMLYGPNAAGKSNLIKAIDYAQQLIRLGSQSYFPIPDTFRFDRQSADTPASFEFRFLVDEQIFTYGFDVRRKGIISEWLVAYRGTREKVIFERDARGTTSIGDAPKSFFASDAHMLQTLTALSQLPIRSTQLFLSRAIALPDDSLGPTLRGIILWLTEDLIILEAGPHSCDMLDRLYDDEAFKNFAERFLCSVDTGICELSFHEQNRDCSDQEREFLQHYSNEYDSPYSRYGCSGDMDERIDPADSSKVIVRQLMSLHRGTDGKVHFALPFGEESDGTQQLLHYLPVLHPQKGRSRVVVIDELDRSLHPKLCWELIQFFSESCPGVRRQMIVTTHEAHLLDQELLRRDEYWMVEKDKTRQSRLTPLTDFKIRKDLNLRKGYLQGRFETELCMPRKSRPLDRTAGVLRDASIIVVACEDTHATKQYFAKFRTRRIQYKVLPTEDNKSSPGAVIERLDRYRNDFAQEDGDELWVCIDADHWIHGNHQRELSRVLQECRQKEYGIAISNPCFEVWLLFHFTDIDDNLLRVILGKPPSSTVSSDDRDSLRCAEFEGQVRKHAGSYTKTKLSNLGLTVSQVKEATERARAGDSSTSDVPMCPGTRIYRLIDSLLNRDYIDLGE